MKIYLGLFLLCAISYNVNSADLYTSTNYNTENFQQDYGTTVHVMSQIPAINYRKEEDINSENFQIDFSQNPQEKQQKNKLLDQYLKKITKNFCNNNNKCNEKNKNKSKRSSSTDINKKNNNKNIMSNTDKKMELMNTDKTKKKEKINKFHTNESSDTIITSKNTNSTQVINNNNIENKQMNNCYTNALNDVKDINNKEEKSIIINNNKLLLDVSRLKREVDEFAEQYIYDKYDLGTLENISYYDMSVYIQSINKRYLELGYILEDLEKNTTNHYKEIKEIRSDLTNIYKKISKIQGYSFMQQYDQYANDIARKDNRTKGSFM